MDRNVAVQQLDNVAERLQTGQTSADFAVGLSGKIHEAVRALEQNDVQDWERSNNTAIPKNELERIQKQYEETGIWDVSDRLQITGTSLLDGRTLAKQLREASDKLKQALRQQPTAPYSPQPPQPPANDPNRLFVQQPPQQPQIQPSTPQPPVPQQPQLPPQIFTPRSTQTPFNAQSETQWPNRPEPV